MASKDARNWRRYTIEFGAAMALYTASVPLTVTIVNRYHPEGLAALAVATIPVIPTLFAFWAFMRQFWRMDELQRRVVSEAMVISALVVGLTTFVYGWVQRVMELPAEPLSFVWIMPALIGVWGVAMPFVKRRYQ